MNSSHNEYKSALNRIKSTIDELKGDISTMKIVKIIYIYLLFRKVKMLSTT